MFVWGPQAMRFSLLSVLVASLLCELAAPAPAPGAPSRRTFDVGQQAVLDREKLLQHRVNSHLRSAEEVGPWMVP